jgi:hypothetical protein
VERRGAPRLAAAITLITPYITPNHPHQVSLAAVAGSGSGSTQVRLDDTHCEARAHKLRVTLAVKPLARGGWLVTLSAGFWLVNWSSQALLYRLGSAGEGSVLRSTSRAIQMEGHPPSRVGTSLQQAAQAAHSLSSAAATGAISVGLAALGEAAPLVAVARSLKSPLLNTHGLLSLRAPGSGSDGKEAAVWVELAFRFEHVPRFGATLVCAFSDHLVLDNQSKSVLFVSAWCGSASRAGVGGVGEALELQVPHNAQRSLDLDW